MYSTSDFRRGLRVLYQGQPHEIVEFDHHKPGKGASVVRTKLKNLATGLTADPTFRSGDKLPKPDLNELDVQYLYSDENLYHFMNPQSYEQYTVSVKLLGDTVNFLVENQTVKLLLFEGKTIGAQVPLHVVLEVVECDPAVRGDTVSGATKGAKLSTGYSCQVPLFIRQGEKVRIDTRTGRYIERA